MVSPSFPSLRNESEVLVCQVSTLGIWSLFDCDSRGPPPPRPPPRPSLSSAPFGPQNRFGLLVCGNELVAQSFISKMTLLIFDPPHSHVTNPELGCSFQVNPIFTVTNVNVNAVSL